MERPARPGPHTAGLETVPAPRTSTEPGSWHPLGEACMLLSFERPSASPAGAFSTDLENCTAMPTSASALERARYGYHRAQPDPPRAELEKA